MKSYADLIEQTFEFPQPEFKVKKNELFFHDIPLMDIIKKYETPLKFTYIPKIGQNIDNARGLFNASMKKRKYEGDYIYCYCTKSSHFSFVLEESLAHGAHIETSSAFDIPLVRKLHEAGKVDKDLYVICNGFKRPLYIKNITELINDGYHNCIPVLDNLNELELYEKGIEGEYQVGIRIAADEEPNFEFYTSRLGIRYSDIIPLYKDQIKPSKKAKLKLLHFFINTGIRDSAYYWSELSRFIFKYCEL
ncbi:MAG: arginine decarboxylase, partial [Cyclobacteriaceae bacterium]|nr:arginine decarboxylase [Cyclobacteriaceae bacterium]